MNKDLSNKIISVAMLAIIIISIVNLGLTAIDYVIPQISVAEIIDNDEEETVESVSYESDTQTYIHSEELLTLFNSLKSKVESYSLHITF